MMELNDSMNEECTRTDNEENYTNCVDAETLCTGEGCKRAVHCARYVGNANREGAFTVENYYTFGSGDMSERGIFITRWCGPEGDWKLFKLLKAPRIPRKIRKLLTDRTKIAQKLMIIDAQVNKYCVEIGITDYDQANLYLHNNIITDPCAAQKNTEQAITDTLSQEKVNKLFKKKERKKRESIRKLPSDKIEAMTADYIAREMTVKEICQKHNVCISTLRKYTPKEQRRTPGRRQVPISKYSDAIRDYCNGELTVEEVCKKYTMSKPHLYRCITPEQREEHLVNRKAAQKRAHRIKKRLLYGNTKQLEE